MVSDREKLHRLGQISAVLRETKLHALQIAAQARQGSLALLAALDAPQPLNDLPAVTEAEVALRYAVWADQRRTEINMGLARQTAAWQHAQSEAAQAFGRDHVMQGLANRPLGPSRRGAKYP
jgi:hypothetical protein